MTNVLKFKKQTRHTAVYETDDPLSPVLMLYVQKSWLAHSTGLTDELVPPLIGIEVKRLSRKEDSR